jgi:hypothetical protein
MKMMRKSAIALLISSLMILTVYALSFIMTWQREEEKDNLKESLLTLTFRIAQNITFAPLADKTIGDKPFRISATASSGLPVNVRAIGNCTLKGNQVTITDAGYCKITALQKGDANYKAAESVSRVFNISKRNQVIAFGTLADKTFGDKPFSISARASSGLFVNVSATGNCILKGNQVAITGAGICQITALQEGNANYKAAKSVIRAFNIGKRNQVIAFGTLADKTYGDKPFRIRAEASSDLFVNVSATGNCTLKGNQVTITDVGRCQITALQEGNANYKAAKPVIQVFNIQAN